MGLALALASAPTFAQSTAAAMSGRIVDDGGAPIADAQVTILHTESGTVSRARTDASGRWAARGLRVGGPYTVTVQKEGFQSTAQEDIYALLAETSSVDLSLRTSATELASIEVLGATQSRLFAPDKMGTGTNIAREQIEGFPSIQRNLQDYARLDPRISQTDKERGEISAVGQNVRFNSITIDGTTTNDTFGLEANNLPTAKQPISIDAIEEVQVNIANYDVTQTRYTGANINAVTKSGTNEFKGSGVYIYRDDSMVGDGSQNRPFSGFAEEETYGGTFSGPLIKDKLFFLVNYENFKRSAPGPDFGPVGGDATNTVGNITVADINELIGVARDVWGFDAGALNVPGLSTEVEDILVKLDWNITDFQRASFRYNRTEEDTVVLPNLNNNTLSLSSHWYTQNKVFETFVGQLYSDWTDNFSTELKVSYRDFDSVPDNQSRLPTVRVDFGGQSVRLGTEQFRHSNVLGTETLNIFFQGDYYAGDHTIRFGVDYEDNDIFNLFVESSLGNYRFSSLQNFRNGVYRDFTFRQANGDNINDAAAEFSLENYGFFLQDSWAASDNLNLLFGLRLDIPEVGGRPGFNQSFFDNFGLRNDATIDGNELFQPRFGFNYSFDTERATQLRGGFGLFQGAAASVWLANPFSNDGLKITTFGCGTAGLASCPANRPAFSPDPDNQPQLAVGGQPAADVDLIDPDLQQPAVWKFNIAIDHELPWWGLVAGAEVIITEVDEALAYKHLNLGAPTGFGPDGRELFWGAAGLDPTRWDRNGQFIGGAPPTRANANRAFREVVLAESTSKGGSESFTLSLQKPMSERWFWQLAYTYTDATEVSPLTSSRAISNFSNTAIVNPNETVAGRSNSAIRDRITAAVSYQPPLFANYKTEISMFYEGRTGVPFSWTFDNDANGDGINNDLLFVPGARGDVLFGSAAEEEAFFAFLADNPGLARFAGGTATRNSEDSKWVNSIDMRFSQELPGLFKGNKAEIWLDIENVLNLIDRDWGEIEEIGFPRNRGVVEFGGIDPASGKFVYRFNNPDNFTRRDVRGESRWRLQVGFRYSF
jgi:hypothetical protein